MDTNIAWQEDSPIVHAQWQSSWFQWKISTWKNIPLDAKLLYSVIPRLHQLQNWTCQLELEKEDPDQKYGEQRLKSVGTSIHEKHYKLKG